MFFVTCVMETHQTMYVRYSKHPNGDGVGILTGEGELLAQIKDANGYRHVIDRRFLEDITEREYLKEVFKHKLKGVS